MHTKLMGWLLLAATACTAPVQNEPNQQAAAILAQPASAPVSPNSVTFQSLRRLVAPLTGKPEAELEPQTPLKNLGLEADVSSPEFLELIVQIESQFMVSIPAGEAAQLATLADLCRLIERLPKKEL
ncbi:MAG: acyl carrier protein [Bernardetiaceae bacterium]|nr:acyl carrier protein [Bernardetiaceae bacterium]